MAKLSANGTEIARKTFVRVDLEGSFYREISIRSNGAVLAKSKVLDQAWSSWRHIGKWSGQEEKLPLVISNITKRMHATGYREMIK